MSIESTAKVGTRIAELDALRGIAASAVVLFHYTTAYTIKYGEKLVPGFEVPWGHFGVQLFFAISGLVIFMTLSRTRSLMDFLVSRFSRLYPAYWAAILLTTAVLMLAGMDGFVQPPAVIAANFTMAQDYLDIASVDGVYWTLAVELAFYCGMAVLWQLRLLDRIEPVLLAWMGLRWVWTFAPEVLGFEPSWFLGTLLIQQHIPFFAIGIAAYRLRAPGRNRRWPLAVILAALLTVGTCDGLPHLMAALVSAAAVLLVALRGLPLLGVRPLVWLGAISYSLYLLHQMIGFALLQHLGSVGIGGAAALCLTLAAMLLLATGVTALIERPALRAIRRWYGDRRSRQVPTGAEPFAGAH